MNSNEILERAATLRMRADTLIAALLSKTHLTDADRVLFSRHANREMLCAVRRIVADLDNLVEESAMTNSAEGYREGVSETLAQIEADRHEPVAPWETEP